VRDRDRVDARPPAVRAAQAREHARAAVEEQAPVTLDEVARLRAAGVRPRRRAPDHGELHRRILPIPADEANGV